MNIGEVGVRLEGLESTIEEVFGPGGYLYKGSLDEVFSYIRLLVGQDKSKIMEPLRHFVTGKKSFDFSTISSFLSKLYSNGKAKVPRADFFARIMGQEISFASLTKNPWEASATYVVESFPSYFKEMFHQMMHDHIDSAHTAQLSVDYILPTIQGTPVKLKLEGTSVLGLKVHPQLNVPDVHNANHSTHTLKIIPSLSLGVSGFIGYDCYLGRLGLEMNNTISANSGASLSIVSKKSEETELQLDLPEKMELFDMTSEIYLMTGIRGRPDIRIKPASLQDIRAIHKSCLHGPENMFGLKFCYDVNVPDVLRSNALPLGEPSTVSLYSEMTEPSVKGYIISVVTQNKTGNKNISLKVETRGSSTPRAAEATWSYNEQDDSYFLSASVESPSGSGRGWATIVVSEDHKAIEAYVQYKTNDTEISRGMKVDFKRQLVRGERRWEVAVCVSKDTSLPPESTIMEGHFKERVSGPDASLDVLFRTKNLLRNYLDISFEGKFFFLFF